LIVHGASFSRKKQGAARCIHGGGTFIFPFIQSYDLMTLDPMMIEAPLKHALSFEMIRVNTPSAFTVGISVDPVIMQNAAKRLLGLTREEIASQARDIIYGQLRLVIASMRIEEINIDREGFVTKVKHNVETELNKIGLELINVNITDISDDSGYLEAVGKKAAQEAIQKAEVDVSEQLKFGESGVTKHQKERKIAVAENQALTIKGENKAKVDVSQSNSELKIKESEYFELSEKRRVEAIASIQETESKALARAAKAKSEQIEQEKRAQHEAPAKADAAKLIVDSEANAQKRLIEARALSEAIYMEMEAKARGEFEILKQKALGLKMLVDSCGGSDQAFKLLLLEHMDHLADVSAKAISGIKFDKVMVWDTQSGGSTSSFIHNIVKSVPPALDLISDISGINLKDITKSNTENPNNETLLKYLEEQKNKYEREGDTKNMKNIQSLIDSFHKKQPTIPTTPSIKNE